MQAEQEISIDFYVNSKNKIQDLFQQLNQSQLIELFTMIQHEVPTVQYSKNKNGYFMDIKQLSSSLIERIEEKANQMMAEVNQ
jgi:hypothetical protein